ncbi:MAG: DUF3795 domain-containing protein [Bacteroidales bacterium]|jgi:hypothetical protein|nr:DUF3795 domain-containing protein [Bacteroidales bacterium]
MKDISVCGIDCAVACIECNKNFEELQQNPCKGCNAAKGKIFWTKFLGLDTCPIYACVENKQLAHCGQCPDLPCSIWQQKDPSMSDEQHEQGIKDRIAVLRTL